MASRTPLRTTQSTIDSSYDTPRTGSTNYLSQSGWGTRSFSSSSSSRGMDSTQASPDRSKRFQSQIEDEIRQLAEDIDKAEEEQAQQLEAIDKKLKSVSETLKEQKSLFFVKIELKFNLFYLLCVYLTI